MIKIRGVLGTDADILFPQISGRPVTDTILWDGPDDLNEYRKSLSGREEQYKQGLVHFFTILDHEKPVGSIDLRPMNDFRADIGLWIAESSHGKGVGTKVIGLICEYGFHKLGLKKIEATVFVGNWASRKIFEKNGFELEGTIRSAVKKRGLLVDEWLLGKGKSSISCGPM